MSEARILQADFRGAILKTQTLKNIPRATHKLATTWAAETLKHLKRSAAGMQTAGKGRKTGQLARSLGMDVSAMEAIWRIMLGTGLQANTKTVYAQIQDKGGTIRAKKKMLTVPWPGILGRARDYADAFIVRSKKGSIILAQRVNKRGVATIKPLFTLRNEVTIPASGWFTIPITLQKVILDRTMTEDNIYRTAAAMTEAKLGGSE